MISKKSYIKILQTYATGFVDNKLSIHFRYDKTKYIIFTYKRKIKNFPKLDITTVFK